jgi:hypothetical protein
MRYVKCRKKFHDAVDRSFYNAIKYAITNWLTSPILPRCALSRRRLNRRRVVRSFKPSSQVSNSGSVLTVNIQHVYPNDYIMLRNLKNRGQVATALQALCNSMVKVADIIDMLNLSIGEELSRPQRHFHHAFHGSSRDTKHPGILFSMVLTYASNRTR